MKNKLLPILFILILSVLYIVSCQDQQKQSESVPGTTSETVQETESEPVEPDLDLEIAQNYSNTVVSAQVAIDYVKKFDEYYVTYDKSILKSMTYYNTVKTLGSTGKNISDSTYHYEWVLDDGTYMQATFYDVIEGDNLWIPLKQRGGTVPAMARCYIYRTSATLDPDLIKSNYPDYSTYLYENFFTEKFESYEEFFDWFGYKELPTAKDVQVPPPTYENIKVMEERLKGKTIKKAKAISVKPGMTLYEAINYVGGLGDYDAAGRYYYEWKVDDDFIVHVGIVDEEDGQHYYDQIITSVEFRPDYLFVMEDQIRID